MGYKVNCLQPAVVIISFCSEAKKEDKKRKKKESEGENGIIFSKNPCHLRAQLSGKKHISAKFQKITVPWAWGWRCPMRCEKG